MVFSSIPAYLDPSNNWQQQGGSIIQHHHHQSVPPLPPPPPPPQQPAQTGYVGGAGSIRPGSMVDRARLSNIPMPEPAQKCPRCESTNTKFCYYNNYNLSQPRHFCKTCRRYWTRGGALRNVPVGGGCRRNKPKVSSSSKNNSNNNNNGSNKSSASSTSTNSCQPSTNSGSTTSTTSLLGLVTPQQIPPLRYMSHLGQFLDHHQHNHFNPSDISLNHSSVSSTISPVLGTSHDHNMNFQLGMSGNFLGGVGVEQWRMQQQQQQQQQASEQFSNNFMGGLGYDHPFSRSGVYPFQGGVGAAQSGFVGGHEASQIRPKMSNSMSTQMASVKMGDNQDQSSSSRQLLGINNPGNQNWSTTCSAWSDLSVTFSSSSPSNPS